MKINANPFHPQTGELLAGYRDAYLRGDLTYERTLEVEAYLKCHAADGDATLQRFAQLHQKGHLSEPVTWVRQQLTHLHQQPQLLRQRIAGFACLGLLVSGAIMAATTLPEKPTVMDGLPVEITTESLTAGVAVNASLVSSSARLISGQILDENGRPLPGATVIDQVSGRGVSTNAEGKYHLLLPQGPAARLQYGYGGYEEEERTQNQSGEVSVTLMPQAIGAKASHFTKLWHKITHRS